MSFNLSISVSGEALYFEVNYSFVCNVSLIYVLLVSVILPA